MKTGSRWLAAAGALLLLSGCGQSDPTALRDWATAAATAVRYRPAAEHFVPERERDAPARRTPARPASVPFGPATGLVPPPEPPPPPENRAARRAAQADAVQALQSVAGTWLEALAQLAGGALIPAREAPFATEAARIARADAAAAAQVTALGAVLAEPGRPNEVPEAALRRLIGQGNSPFQSVMTALREQVVLLGGNEFEEREAIILQSERLAGQARRTAARQDAQDARDALLTGQSGRGAARQAYLSVVERIMETHRMLWRERDALSRAETAQALRRAEASLRRASQGLPR